MRFSLLQFVAASTVAVIVSVPTWADTPGKHPAYLHALTDLRDARAHLEHFSSDAVDHQEEHAIGEIDKAIGEIKHAAIMDGKDVRDHMPVDAHLVRRDRFHKAMELLEKAKRDVSGEEDQPDTQGLQLRVIHHIDEAERAVRHAIETVLGGG
jgi:predicted metal-dependent hydrolase